MTQKSVEKHRMRELLAEAVSVLCKASLEFRYKFSVEGLLGITLDDDDVFLVNINEVYQKDERPPLQRETSVMSDAGSIPKNTDISPPAMLMNNEASLMSPRKRHLSSTDSVPCKERRISSPSADYSQGVPTLTGEEYENQRPVDPNAAHPSMRGMGDFQQYHSMSQHKNTSYMKHEADADYPVYKTSPGTDSDATNSSGLPSTNNAPLSKMHQPSHQQQMLLGSLHLTSSCPDPQWKNLWGTNETVVQNKRRSFAFPECKGVMIPLYADPNDPEKYSDVLVDSTAISELQSQSSRSRNPGAYLLNGLIDIIFTKEELATSKGITSKEVPLNPHKVEACKDFVWAKCRMKGWCPPEKFTRIFSNKIGNARRDLKTQQQRFQGEHVIENTQAEGTAESVTDNPPVIASDVKVEDAAKQEPVENHPALEQDLPHIDSCQDEASPVRPDPVF